MADGNVKTGAMSQEYCGTAPVFVGESFLFDLGIPSMVVHDHELGAVSLRFVLMARAVLRMSNLRGDNEADMPGTLTQAVEGAEVLLDLAIGFAQIAENARTKLAEAEEVSHG